jgi:hypothetical protein
VHNASSGKGKAADRGCGGVTPALSTDSADGFNGLGTARGGGPPAPSRSTLPRAGSGRERASSRRRGSAPDAGTPPTQAGGVYAHTGPYAEAAGEVGQGGRPRRRGLRRWQVRADALPGPSHVSLAGGCILVCDSEDRRPEESVLLALRARNDRRSTRPLPVARLHEKAPRRPTEFGCIREIRYRIR